MKLRVQIDSQTYEVEVGDLNTRPILATIDGETFEVWPEDQAVPAAAAAPSAVRPTPSVSTPAPASGAAPAASTDKAKAVLAPIPGVIITINVKEGDSVTVGQEVCVLEAMKMKNSIRANRAGKIAAVRVSTGDQVRKDQVLLEYSD